MTRRDTPEPEVQFGAAWDALVLDSVLKPDGMPDSPLFTTVRRLHDLDDAAAPDPTFVRDLRARFAAPSARMLAERAALGGRESNRQAPVGRVIAHPAAPEPIRLWPARLQAVAVILVLALVGGIVVGLDRVDDLVRGDHRPGAATVLPGIARIPAGPAVPDVPMFQGDPQRTGDLPGPGPVSMPTVLWSFATGGSITGAPVVVDGVVYVGGADGTLTAVDALTGAERWAFAAGTGITSSPAVVDGAVYVGAGDMATDAAVLAIDATTGRERWRQAIKDPVAGAPLAVDGGLYIGTESGILYALDAATGEERWTFPTRGTIWAAPSYAGGTIFVESWDGYLYAIDGTTGTERWRFNAGGPIWVSAPVSDGTVFVVTPNGFQPASYQPLSLFALDAASGRTIWRTELPRSTTEHDPEVPPVTVAGGTVYLQRNRNFYAVDAGSGALQWDGATTPSEDVRVSAQAETVIYICRNGHLLAFDGTNGTRLWEVVVSDDTLGWPVVTGGFIYVGDAGGVLYALSADQSVPASPQSQP